MFPAITPRICSAASKEEAVCQSMRVHHIFDHSLYWGDGGSSNGFELLQTYRGLVVDEWSIFFSHRGNGGGAGESSGNARYFWAEVWFDHEKERIYGLVQTGHSFSESVPCCMKKIECGGTLQELAHLLQTHTRWAKWDEYIVCDINAERARSREYKAHGFTQLAREAVAMSLHPRLGSSRRRAWNIGCLGADVIRVILQ